MKWQWFLLLSLVWVLPLAGAALAMHEADHRYRVSGYVRDEAGKPKSDLPVLLEHKGEGGQKKKVTTNRWGYYEHIFHLHNSNLDDKIVVTAGSEVATHTVKFDPEDGVSERYGEVNFGAPAAHFGGLIYGTVGSVAVLLGVLYFYKKRKVAEKVIHKSKKGSRHGKRS